MYWRATFSIILLNMNWPARSETISGMCLIFFGITWTSHSFICYICVLIAAWNSLWEILGCWGRMCCVYSVLLGAFQSNNLFEGLKLPKGFSLHPPRYFFFFFLDNWKNPAETRVFLLHNCQRFFSRLFSKSLLIIVL